MDSRFLSLRASLLFACLVACVLPGRAAAIQRDEQLAKRLARYQEQHRSLAEEYSAKLTEIAAKAEAAGFAEDGKRIRELAVPFDPATSQTDLPKTPRDDLPVVLPENEEWRLALRKTREDYANKLYSLSRNMLHAKFPSAAYRLIREVARANPDHLLARRILGYQRKGSEWTTPFAIQQEVKRLVWHDKFGWLKKDEVKRYEAGERRFGTRWMSAEQEAEIRRDFRNAWVVRTEHFLIKTNHSLERGVEVAKKLEDYYDFCLETFPGFFQSPNQLKVLFGNAGRTRKVSLQRPFVVHYYRTREEYVRELKKDVPQVGITNGLYHNGTRVSYFYHAPEENNDSTLYHEATHQLFYETRFSKQNSRQVGTVANFWIIEGIACYMESLKRKNGQITLGDPLFVRFYWARNRYLSQRYYVPLGRFASMGMNQFQGQPPEQLSWNYSQASGLAHFFMHAEDGAYRDALIEHLSQIYDPARRNKPVQTLAELTGFSFEELDGKYGEYLKAQQKSVDDRQPLLPAGK